MRRTSDFLKQSFAPITPTIQDDCFVRSAPTCHENKDLPPAFSVHLISLEGSKNKLLKGKLLFLGAPSREI